MQNAMHHHTPQFGFKQLLFLPCIVFHPVDADIDITGNDFVFRIVEGDHVGIIVVFQEIAVDAQEVFVAAENEVEVPAFLFAGQDNLIQPVLGFEGFAQFEARQFGMETDGAGRHEFKSVG
jgi:hypothetical protein